MKKVERIASWTKNLSLYRERFDRCVNFLRANTETVKQFHRRALLNYVSADEAAKHRLYFLFIDCLGAAGGNHLTNSAIASEEFLKTMEEFGLDRTISFKRFAEKIGAKPESTERMFKILAGGKFKNFRERRRLSLCAI